MRYRLIVGTTLLGFIAGTALFGFIVGAATLSVVAVATTANAYPIGGSTGMSHSSIGIHNSLSSSLGDSRRRNTFKKPFDSDGGDPTPNSTGSGGGPKSTGNYQAPRRPGRAHNPQRTP
jgi:hypothetical protein